MKREKSDMANLKINEVEKILKLAEKYNVTGMEYENLAFNRIIIDKETGETVKNNIKLIDKDYLDPIEEIQGWNPDGSESRDPEA